MRGISLFFAGMAVSLRCSCYASRRKELEEGQALGDPVRSTAMGERLLRSLELGKQCLTPWFRVYRLFLLGCLQGVSESLRYEFSIVYMMFVSSSSDT